jgi:hypothetical protein
MRLLKETLLIALHYIATCLLDSENPDNCAVSFTVYLKRQTHPRLMSLASKRKMTSKSGERLTLVYGEATMDKWVMFDSR